MEAIFHMQYYWNTVSMTQWPPKFPPGWPVVTLLTRLYCTYGVVIGNIYKLVHLLIHADDVTIIATSRENAVAKMRTLLHIAMKIISCLNLLR